MLQFSYLVVNILSLHPFLGGKEVKYTSTLILKSLEFLFLHDRNFCGLIFFEKTINAKKGDVKATNLKEISKPTFCPYFNSVSTSSFFSLLAIKTFQSN